MSATLTSALVAVALGLALALHFLIVRRVRRSFERGYRVGLMRAADSLAEARPGLRETIHRMTGVT